MAIAATAATDTAMMPTEAIAAAWLIGGILSNDSVWFGPRTGLKKVLRENDEISIGGESKVNRSKVVIEQAPPVYAGRRRRWITSTTNWGHVGRRILRG